MPTLSAESGITSLSGREPGSTRPLLYLTISASMAIRNFFLTPVLDMLAEHFDLEILATPATATALQTLRRNAGIRITVIDPGPEPRLWKWLRQAKKKVYMEGRQSATEAIWEKYTWRPFYQRFGGALLKRLIRLINAGRLYEWFESLDLSINRNSDLVEKFQAQPAFLFATHATTYFEEYIYRNARKARIPKLYMILSWDHLSSKVLMHHDFDRVLVWNRHTQTELLQTYKGYTPETVRIVGIPQFDAYREKPRMKYGEWCIQHGLDPARRTILFSTMPQQRHEQQHIVLEELLKEIAKGQKVPADTQVLIKCHPWDNFPGYDKLLDKYPVGIIRSSLLPNQSLEEWLPKANELEISRDCLYFCSLNINIFSTVTIEASLFDKPIVHIAYDPLPVKNRIPCREYYNWEHFRHIVEKNATILVHSHEELFSAVSEYLAHPERRKAERRLLTETYVGKPVGSACASLVEEMIRFKRERVAR